MTVYSEILDTTGAGTAKDIIAWAGCGRTLIGGGTWKKFSCASLRQLKGITVVKNKAR